MKKIQNYILSFFFVSGVLYSQNFIYTPSETHSSIELGGFIAPSGTIQNISDDSLTLAIIRTDLDLPQDWTNKMCFGGICFPPEWDSLDTADPGPPFYQSPIPPDSTIYFSVWFTAFSNYPGTATATLKLYDLNDPQTIHTQDFMASTENFSIVHYMNDWNLVGMSVLNDDAYYTDIYPDVIPGTLYGFTDSYYQTTDMEEGVGYWLRFNNVGMTAIFGENIEDISINLNADWNLITGISESVELFQFDDPEEIIIPGTLFGFNGTYEQVSTLIPGKGYWIRAINSGVISVSPNFTR